MATPLQYSCLEKSHGQRSLVGYSPWGHKESDKTERLNTDTHTRVQNSPRGFEAHDCQATPQPLPPVILVSGTFLNWRLFVKTEL